MNRATNSAYMGKGKQQMAKPQQQAAGSQQEQMKQQIKMIAQKLMQEKGMEKEQAVETAKQMIKQQMAQQSSEQEGMPEYNLGGTIGSAVGAVGGTLLGVGPGVGATVGGSAGTLIGEAVGGDKNPEQFTGRKREEYDTLMNKSKGKDSVFYKHGGNINKAPGMKSQYEAEGGEVVEGEAPKVTGEEGKMKEQTDDTYVIKGPSHENGGVEGKGGDRVFSDSIKIPGTSQTYADAAKKIGSRTGQKSMEKKMEAKPYDQILKRSLDRTKQRNEAQKNKLFELQEQQKDVEGIDNNNQKMEYGGEVDTATSDYDVVEDEISMKKFRQTYPEQEMKYGGELPKYFNGGKFGDPENIPERQALKQSTTLRDPGSINKTSTIEQESEMGGIETPTPEKAAINSGMEPTITPGQFEEEASGWNDDVKNSTNEKLSRPGMDAKIQKTDLEAPKVSKIPTTDSGEAKNAAFGPNDIGGSDMTPAQKNLYERMMQQQEKTDKLTPIGRAAQAAPAMYNLMDSDDRNYLDPQKNRRAEASISQLEDMPTEYNIQDQLRGISDAYDKTTDQMNRYSASPNVARANMRNAFAKRLGAESKAYNTKQNKETQLEAQKDRALAQQQYQVGSQAAKYRDKANMMNLKTEAAAENQKRTGLNQLSNLAGNINREEQDKLTELQTRNLQYEKLGDSGVGSRMAADSEYMNFVMNERPEYAKKHFPKLYKQWKKKNKSQ